MKAKVLSFFAGIIFMMVFGIIDNAGIVLGMDIFNPIVNMFGDPKLSAMLGNTFSDVLGAIGGLMISWLFLKLFKVKPMENIFSELIGVTIGCLIPIGIYLLF